MCVFKNVVLRNQYQKKQIIVLNRQESISFLRKTTDTFGEFLDRLTAMIVKLSAADSSFAPAVRRRTGSPFAGFVILAVLNDFQRRNERPCDDCDVLGFSRRFARECDRQCRTRFRAGEIERTLRFRSVINCRDKLSVRHFRARNRECDLDFGFSGPRG